VTHASKIALIIKTGDIIQQHIDT